MRKSIHMNATLRMGFCAETYHILHKNWVSLVVVNDPKTSDLSGKQLCWANINVWGVSMTGFEMVTPSVGLVFGVVNTDQFSIFGFAMRACVTAQNFARNAPLLVTLHSDWNSIIGWTIGLPDFGWSDMQANARRGTDVVMWTLHSGSSNFLEPGHSEWTSD